MKKIEVLVTGATDGIGRQTALDLARRGALPIVHGRTREKAEAAAAAIGAELGGAPPPAVAGDLSSVAGVRALASEVHARAPGLQVLVSNAGVFETERVVTMDGFERTFMVNHLAPLLLTHLLLDRLVEQGPSRVVFVSSVAHNRGRIDLSDLQHERRFDGYAAYSASKLANVLTANELARRLDPTRVTVHSLEPGVIATKLLQKGFNMSGASVEEGARTSVFAALDPSLEGKTGLYLGRAQVARSSSDSRDPELMRRFYEESCRLLGLTPWPARAT